MSVRPCVCLYAFSRFHFFVDVQEKWHGGNYNPTNENEFVGINSGPPLSYYALKLSKMGANWSYS